MAAIKKPRLPKKPKASASNEVKERYLKRVNELKREYEKRLSAQKSAKRKSEVLDKKIQKAISGF